MAQAQLALAFGAVPASIAVCRSGRSRGCDSGRAEQPARAGGEGAAQGVAYSGARLRRHWRVAHARWSRGAQVLLLLMMLQVLPWQICVNKAVTIQSICALQRAIARLQI